LRDGQREQSVNYRLIKVKGKSIMAMNPQSALDNPRQIGAALFVVGTEDTVEELESTITLVWVLQNGVPVGTAEEAWDAIEVTGDLLAQINALMQADSNYVPEGMTSERWAFYREALADGLAALEAEFPEMEEIEDIEAEFDMFHDLLVATGAVQAVTFEFEPVDLSDEDEPEGQPEGT